MLRALLQKQATRQSRSFSNFSKLAPCLRGSILSPTAQSGFKHLHEQFPASGRRFLSNASALPVDKLTPARATSLASLRRQLLAPISVQVRFAGRIGGVKRKKRSDWVETIHQRGLGKRMEFFWPKGKSRTRVPMYENSRRHVIYDHNMKRWLVMWYRHGMQVFKAFGAQKPSIKFEQARMRAIVFYKKLKDAGKLGRPKPDQCRSGVRGVVFDRDERAWVAKWNHCGLRMHAVYGTQELGFEEAYKRAVRSRVHAIRDQHKFVFQRTRWKGKRRPLGTHQT